MKRIFFALILIAALIGCKDEACEKSIDSIFAAKSAYESQPDTINCLLYRAELEAFIQSTCEHDDPQVDYDAIFQSYLDQLPCEPADTITPPPPVIPTCDDGIMNGDETDVDCGGASCLPCADIYIRYSINGTAYDHEPTQYSMFTGGAPEANHNITSGNIINSNTQEARINFKFFNTNQITLAEFQSIVNVAIPLETSGQTFAELIYNGSGVSHTTDGAGNDAVNSMLTVTSVTELTGSTTLYNVSGTFSCKIKDSNDDIQDITDGEFSMVYRSLQ
ncbi:MAG: hypothetical protein ACPG4Z_00215 [Chitinophagales bacterium]